MPATAIAPALAPFLMLAVKDLKPSALNPRKHFDQGKLQELANTMTNGVGVIEPLVARPIGNHHEIVAGERRWRAAQLAGLTEVPTVIKALTDAQVLEVMVIENNQREDVNALEEADGFKRLLKFGFDIDQLAKRLGRSRKYVYDRIKLLDLVPAAQKLLLDGRLSPAIAILLARLTPEHQGAALDDGVFRSESSLFNPTDDVDEERRREKADPFYGMTTRSVREVQGWIDEHVRFLPNTEVNHELFPQTTAAIEEAAKVISITYNHHVHPDAKDGSGQRIYSVVSWKRADGLAKSKQCDKSVVGVLVVGPDRGQAFDVCVNKECATHWGAEKRAKEKRAAQAAKPAVERKPDQWEIQRQKAEAQRAKIEKALPAVRIAVIGKLKSASVTQLARLLAERFQTQDVAAVTKRLEVKPKTAEDFLRVFAATSALHGIRDAWGADRNLPALGKALGLDVAGIIKKANATADVQTSAQKAAPAKRAAKKR